MDCTLEATGAGCSCFLCFSLPFLVVDLEIHVLTLLFNDQFSRQLEDRKVSEYFTEGFAVGFKRL